MIFKRAREAKLKNLVKTLSNEDKANVVEGVSFGDPERGQTSGLRFERQNVSLFSKPKDTLMVVPEEEEIPTGSYPSQSALGCSFDTELVRDVFAALASDKGRFGSSVVLGASAGIKRDPSAGGNVGYFSEDPVVAGTMAAAAAEGIVSSGYKACVSDVGSAGRYNMRYVTDAAVDKRTLNEILLKPAEIAVSRCSPASISLTEGRIRGEFASESRELITDKIRNEWGYKGVVMGSPGSVSDRVESLLAGLDVEMTGCRESASDLVNAVNDGEVPPERLMEAAERAVVLADRNPGTKQYNEAQTDQLTRMAADSCAVLLKNLGGMFPIENGEEFALIGVHAMTLPATESGTRDRIGNPDSLMMELQNLGARFKFASGYTHNGDTNGKLVSEAVDAAVETGKAVIVIGVPDAGNSDRENISLPNGILKLVDSVSSACFQTAVVLVTGGPVELPFADRVSTILALYYSGDHTAGAAADVILGRTNPSGKLAETWPKKLNDCPAHTWFTRNRRYTEHREGIYVGYRYYLTARVPTLYDFGHGLSYTRFTYSDMAVTEENGGWTVSVKITNAGNRHGSEAVQFYAVRPDDEMLELKGFVKVHLVKGETKTVSISLTPHDFRRYDEKLSEFRVYGGDYMIFAASSSTDLRERAEIHVDDDGKGDFPKYFTSDRAGQLSDSEFRKLIGYEPDSQISSIISLESTPNDLMRNTMGAGLVHEIAATILQFEPNESELDDFMKKTGDIPLRTLSDLLPDLFPRSKAESIVKLGNRDFIGSATSLLFGRRRRRG